MGLFDNRQITKVKLLQVLDSEDARLTVKAKYGTRFIWLVEFDDKSRDIRIYTGNQKENYDLLSMIDMD